MLHRKARAGVTPPGSSPRPGPRVAARSVVTSSSASDGGPEDRTRTDAAGEEPCSCAMPSRELDVAHASEQLIVNGDRPRGPGRTRLTCSTLHDRHRPARSSPTY